MIRTSTKGIFQSDILIRTAIMEALKEMKENPWLLDYVFSWLPDDDLSKNTYGVEELEQAKKWFLNTEIAVTMAYRTDRPELPCIAIELVESVESGANSLGDIHYEPTEDVDATEIVIKPSSVLGPFSPATYDYETGIITLPAPLTTEAVYPGNVLYDAASNRGYVITDVLGDDSFAIAAETNANFTRAYVAPRDNYYTAHLESVEFRETYRLRCYANTSPVHLTFLHSILTFILLRSKQDLLEARGFERTTVSASGVQAGAGETDKELIYVRDTTISGYVRQYWPKSLSKKIDGIFLEIRIADSGSTPAAAEEGVQSQGWMLSEDEDDQFSSLRSITSTTTSTPPGGSGVLRPGIVAGNLTVNGNLTVTGLTTLGLLPFSAFPPSSASNVGSLLYSLTDNEVLISTGTGWESLGSGGGGSAAEITFDPSGGISATNVQDAIEELETDLQAEIDALGTPVASGVTFTPVGGISSVNVQAAIAELQTDLLAAISAIPAVPVTLAAVGAAPNANAATLTGQTLNLQPASASFPGVVTTGAQSFAGDKSFSGAVAAETLSATSYVQVGAEAFADFPDPAEGALMYEPVQGGLYISDGIEWYEVNYQLYSFPDGVINASWHGISASAYVSPVDNAADAVAFDFTTYMEFSTPGAILWQVRNSSQVRASLDYAGNLVVANSVSSGTLSASSYVQVGAEEFVDFPDPVVGGLMYDPTQGLLFVSDGIGWDSVGSGGGGDSLWEAYDTDVITPSGTVHSATLVENDPNSRDNPQAVFIFKNLGLDDENEFAIGNPYIAGVGLCAMGIWSRNTTTLGDTVPWKLNFSWEESGTLASILDGVERSAFESFINHGDFKPWFRIEASSRGINFGSSTRAAPGQVSRTSNVVTVVTVTPHRFSQDDELWRTQSPYDGNPSDLTLFGPESTGPSSFVVSEVVDANTFRYLDVGTDGTSAGGILYSKETDVTFGRDGTNLAAVRVNGSTVTQFNEFGISIPSGLSVLGSGASLQLGAAGIGVLELTADQVHVQNGKTFYQEGTYKSTGWYNGGGQTQTTQEVFIVGTGSGNKTTTLRTIDADWIRLMVHNHGEGGANTLEIIANAGNTINGAASLTIPANAGATVVSVGTDWRVFYHPAPP